MLEPAIPHGTAYDFNIANRINQYNDFNIPANETSHWIGTEGSLTGKPQGEIGQCHALASFCPCRFKLGTDAFNAAGKTSKLVGIESSGQRHMATKRMLQHRFNYDFLTVAGQ